jgi:glucose-6-phosphatase
MGTLFMLTVVAGTYSLLMYTGVDPGWTIAKAVKWCYKKEHVHMDTTPFFSIMRYTGFFLGAGIGLSAAPEPLVVRPPHTSRPNESMKVRGINFLTAITSIVVIHLFNSVPIPTGNMIMFYSLSFLMNTVQPVLFIALIPRLVTRLFSVGKQRLA